MSESKGLPEGWVEVLLGKCGIWQGGGTPSKANDSFWRNGTVPWISPKDMKMLRLADSEDHISRSAIEETNVKPFPKGTVLIVIRSGILGRTLPVAVADVSATMNQDLKGIHPAPWLDSLYLAYLLRCREISILRNCSKNGTTVPSIDTSALHAVPIQIPPLSEQHRIVEKIEELFSHLDAGIQAMKRAKANLKRYRASVLKSAVEGMLTEEWRKDHPQTEDGQMLLDRLIRERREKWEQSQLKKFEEKGKEPPKNRQAKYEEPSAPDTSALPALPEGWAWAAVEQVGEVVTGTTPPTANRAYYGTHIPFLSPSDLEAGYAVTTGNSALSEEGLTHARWTPERTTLVTCIGATIGKTGFTRMPCTTNQQINAVVVPPIGNLPEWFFWTQRSPRGQQEIKRNASATTLPLLNKSKFQAILVPLPPLAEQEQIVALVEERLSQIDAADKTIDAELIRSKRLRQSILKQAFEGKLVPQNPKDEPASILLERIKASREAEPPKKAKKAKGAR